MPGIQVVGADRWSARSPHPVAVDPGRHAGSAVGSKAVEHGSTLQILLGRMAHHLPTGDAMLFEWLLGSYLLLIDWLIRLVALCWIPTRTTPGRRAAGCCWWASCRCWACRCTCCSATRGFRVSASAARPRPAGHPRGTGAAASPALDTAAGHRQRRNRAAGAAPGRFHAGARQRRRPADRLRRIAAHADCRHRPGRRPRAPAVLPDVR